MSYMLSEIRQAILEAVSSLIEQLKAEYDDNDVYALVFYPSSGYADIGMAYATKTWLSARSVSNGPELDDETLEMLRDHPDLLQQVQSHRRSPYYYEVNACEWDHPRPFAELFAAANALLDGLGDSESVEKLLTEVLLEVRNAGWLENHAFAEDVLLGIQFPDPDSKEIEVVKRVSRVANSAAWHAKVSNGYGI